MLAVVSRFLIVALDRSTQSICPARKNFPSHPLHVRPSRTVHAYRARQAAQFCSLWGLARLNFAKIRHCSNSLVWQGDRTFRRACFSHICSWTRRDAFGCIRLIGGIYVYAAGARLCRIGHAEDPGSWHQGRRARRCCACKKGIDAGAATLLSFSRLLTRPSSWRGTRSKAVGRRVGAAPRGQMCP